MTYGFHYTGYGAAVVMFVHGTLIDPELKNRPPDFLDGEKILVEVCCCLVIAGIIWRIRRGTASCDTRPQRFGEGSRPSGKTGSSDVSTAAPKSKFR